MYIDECRVKEYQKIIEVILSKTRNIKVKRQYQLALSDTAYFLGDYEEVLYLTKQRLNNTKVTIQTKEDIGDFSSYGLQYKIFLYRGEKERALEIKKEMQRFPIQAFRKKKDWQLYERIKRTVVLYWKMFDGAEYEQHCFDKLNGRLKSGDKIYLPAQVEVHYFLFCLAENLGIRSEVHRLFVLEKGAQTVFAQYIEQELNLLNEPLPPTLELEIEAETW